MIKNDPCTHAFRVDVPEERDDGERHPAHHPDIRDRGHRLVKSRDEDRRYTVRISAVGGSGTRPRRTVGNIDCISNADNTTSNDSQDRDDNSGLYFSDNP
jgi:hypothetical protein